MKKLMLVGLMTFAFAAALKAAPIVRIDFPCQNFWGNLTAVTELPDGVWIGERQGFWDKRKKGYSFPVFVDLAKAKSFDVTFKFVGTGAKIVRMAPALTGYLTDAHTTEDQTELKCVEFEIDGDKSAVAPCVFKHWKSMTPFVAATEKELKPGSVVKAGQKYWQIFVVDGKTIRVKAKFENPLE
jgi:hypothetical protein